jgi:hypothetical protein
MARSENRSEARSLSLTLPTKTFNVLGDQRPPWMAHRYFARANPFSRKPTDIRGVSSDRSWHRITSDQSARGRWIPGPPAIQDGQAKRQSATYEQG